MKRPGRGSSSTALRTAFQEGGQCCHSSIRIGSGAVVSRLGSASKRSIGSVSSRWTVAARCSRGGRFADRLRAVDGDGEQVGDQEVELVVDDPSPVGSEGAHGSSATSGQV